MTLRIYALFATGLVSGIAVAGETATKTAVTATFGTHTFEHARLVTTKRAEGKTEQHYLILSEEAQSCADALPKGYSIVAIFQDATLTKLRAVGFNRPDLAFVAAGTIEIAMHDHRATGRLHVPAKRR